MSREASSPPVTLSVIIPVFNEKQTLLALLDKVQRVPLDKQIIIVDDGSTDSTHALLASLHPSDTLTILRHSANRGKGAAIRTALPYVKGQIVVIQDADLEYDPQDYLALVQPLLNGETQVVYGSRDLMPGNSYSHWLFFLGGKFLTWLTNRLYGSRLTDVTTCYKAFSAQVLKSLPLTCQRFEFCPEVTARLLHQGYTIHEVPIRYFPRTFRQGKKIRMKDGLVAAWTLLRLRCHMTRANRPHPIS
ncbi:MAG: glycosyltransferase family 2 protein [Nitrospirae bacterium]|nr:MAG: glycosyltransferase family 2 protein [Nitrospirota bacterium]